MNRLISPLIASLALIVLAGGADAACFADYKAKRTDPLRLHYGVIELDDAECGTPDAAVADRIANDGWELLTIMDVFDRAGAEKRETDAGAYYLRY